MKITWKIFFVFTSFITVIFCSLGMWLISASFNNSYGRIIADGSRENKLFRLAFETNMNAFSEEEINAETVAGIAEAIIDNLEQNGYLYKVYKEDELIYESNGFNIDNSIKESFTGSINSGYETVKKAGSVYVVFLCRSECDDETYYLETIKNITEIYTERDNFYYQYCIAIAVLLVCTVVIVLILSHVLTKSVVELSDTTRQFADGNYEVRASVKSADEIGRLAEDFNSMADSLATKMDELVWAARKQEDFSASFAHELKTPLTSIIGYSEMLRTMELDREETMEAADYIYSEGKRLKALSAKLLDLVGLDKQNYNFSNVLAINIIKEAEKATKTLLTAKKIKFKTEMADGYIYGEYDLLVSLFVNLIDNARKAVPENGVITVIGLKKQDSYEITVKDSGCGIPEDEIDKITEAFYMADKSRSRKEGGAGLGLSLCSKIVRIHNAEWTIDSTYGAGTSVTISFPEAEKQ